MMCYISEYDNVSVLEMRHKISNSISKITPPELLKFVNKIYF